MGLRRLRVRRNSLRQAVSSQGTLRLVARRLEARIVGLGHVAAFVCASPAVLSYYYGLVLTGREVASQIVWEVAKVVFTAYCLIAFVSCARHGSGQTTPEDRRLVDEAGNGNLLPLPPGVFKAIDTMGVYPRLEGCDLDVPKAFLAYLRTREVDLDRARIESGLDGPYFRYDFTSGGVDGLRAYAGRKRRRASEGGPSAAASGDLPVFTPLTRRNISQTATLDFCRRDYDAYCRRRDGVRPSSRPTPKDDVSDHGALDDDWTLQASDDDWTLQVLEDSYGDREFNRQLVAAIRGGLLLRIPSLVP